MIRLLVIVVIDDLIDDDKIIQVIMIDSCYTCKIFIAIIALFENVSSSKTHYEGTGIVGSCDLIIIFDLQVVLKPMSTLTTSLEIISWREE